MKHAILIQCHTCPEMVRSVIKKLTSDNHYFFVHVDSKYKDYYKFQKLQSDHVFLTDRRYNVHWGAEEQIYLTLELINKANSLNLQYDYYHLISGQDYPTCTNTDFDRFFEDKPPYSFMELDDHTKITDRFMLFHCNKFFDVRRSLIGNFWESSVVNWQRRLTALLSLRPEIGLTPYKGNNWWSLHKSAVDYIIGFCNKHPEYKRRFRFTSCCDEVFFHTILFNSSIKPNIVLDDLRYVDWKRKSPDESLPRLLTETDYNEIKKTKKIFMRKVDLIKSASLIEKF